MTFIWCRVGGRLAMVGLLIGLVALSMPGASVAAPTVTIKGEAVPIPGFPHTGNFFGAGAAVHAEVAISGVEYGGFPPPLIGVNVYLPTGVKLHPQGFPTCPPKTIIEEAEPERCPKGSAAGPIVGHRDGFGRDRARAGGLTPVIDMPIDRKGLDVIVIAWTKTT